MARFKCQQVQRWAGFFFNSLFLTEKGPAAQHDSNNNNKKATFHQQESSTQCGFENILTYTPSSLAPITHTHTHTPYCDFSIFNSLGGSGLSVKITKSVRHRKWDRARQRKRDLRGKTPGQQRHRPEEMKVSWSSFLITLFKALTGEKVSWKTVLTSYIWHSSLPACAAQLSAFSVLPFPSLFTYLHSSAVREITWFFKKKKSYPTFPNDMYTVK